MPSPFIHLRLHTEFSLTDSTIRIKSLVNKVAGMGMPACGITDFCNFYGLIKFYKACQGAGIKPICGADFLLASGQDDGAASQLTLLAMNNQGYKNITQLISMAYQQGQRHGVPYLQREGSAVLARV